MWMIYDKLSMPATNIGWTILISLGVIVVGISIWFDNRFFKRNKKIENTSPLEKEGFEFFSTAHEKSHKVTHDMTNQITDKENRQTYEHIDEVSKTSSVVTITFFDNSFVNTIEYSTFFTNEEKIGLSQEEIHNRRKNLRQEVLSGVLQFDNIEKVDSDYYVDEGIIIGKTYIKQNLTEGETVLGIQSPITYTDLEEYLLKQGYKNNDTLPY